MGEANSPSVVLTLQHSLGESQILWRASYKIPYPITSQLGAGLLAYLVDTKRLCYNTLSTVTYAALLRLNLEATKGKEVLPEVREAMRRNLGEIRVRDDLCRVASTETTTGLWRVIIIV